MTGQTRAGRANAFAGHLLVPKRGVTETLTWVSSGRVTERALVALMERFGVSYSALIYQLLVLKLITFDQATRLRGCRVGDLVHRHRDVAPSGAAITVRRTVRAPERLLGTAVRAARAEQIGLSVVANLLERDDDESLWSEVMESDTDEMLAGATPKQ